MSVKPHIPPSDRSALEDLLPEPKQVIIGRGALTIRGLEMQEMARLLAAYKGTLMGYLAGQKQDWMGLLVASPELVTDIIAMASGYEDEQDRAKLRRIPPQFQLDCLEAVYKLSVPDEKKLGELLTTFAATFRSLVRGPQPESSIMSNSETPSLSGQTP